MTKIEVLFRLWIAASLVLPLASCSQKGERELQIGEWLTEEVSPGDEHRFAFEAPTQAYLYLVAIQRGADINVELLGPHGGQLQRSAGPGGPRGNEVLAGVLEEAGQYVVAVRTVSQGAYQLKLGEVRKAQDGDIRRAQAALDFAEASQLTWLGDQAAVERAIDLYESTIPTWEELGEWSSKAATLGNTALAYEQLGDFGRAIQLNSEALALAKSQGNGREEAVALSRQGEYLRVLGDPLEALASWQEAMNYWEEVEDQVKVAEISNNLGLIARDLGDRDEELRYYLEALKAQRRAGDANAKAGTLINLSLYYGTEPKAESYALEALGLLGDSNSALRARALHALGRALRETPAATGPLREALAVSRAIGDQRLEATSLYELAERDGREGRFADAEARVREALAVLDSVRDGIGDDLLRASYLATYDRSYELLVSVLMAQGLESRAFEASEESRARTLVESLGGQGQVATVEEALRAVGDHTTLVKYSLGEERGYGWMLTTQGVRSFELPPRNAIEQTVRGIRRALNARATSEDGEQLLERRSRIAEADAEYWRLATRLSAMLLKGLPIETSTLVVVPDEALTQVPFAALPLEPGVPLIDQMSVVVTPSVGTANLLLDRLTRNPGNEVAVIADPEVQGEWGRLPFAKLEAEAILGMAGPDRSWAATGVDATLASLQTEAVSQARWLHLATHGDINDAYPRESGLVLADGPLRLPDIAALDLQAQLVVLSGCETAAGRQLQGEGLMALTRGFFEAGAGQVIASLWSVPDHSTGGLMVRFYERLLRDGEPPHRALRLAQRDMWRSTKTSAPYYWAAFGFYGAWTGEEQL